jgi:HEAT repeat protein
LRNAALVLGGRGAAATAAVPALVDRLDDADPIVRAAAAWALGQIATEAALAALEARRDDPDPEVRATVTRALERAEFSSSP